MRATPTLTQTFVVAGFAVVSDELLSARENKGFSFATEFSNTGSATGRNTATAITASAEL